MQDTREALRRAVVTLVEAPDAEYLYESLTAALSLARVHPIQLTGDAASVNPLLDLGARDPAALDRALQLVDAKRVESGKPPLATKPQEGFDKVEYMRVFMDQKRQRQRRAADIENMQRPARDRLVGRARLDFMDRVAAEWKRELDALIARARENVSTRLPKDHLETIRTQFWSSVDTRLDEAEQAAKEKPRRA